MRCPAGLSPSWLAAALEAGLVYQELPQGLCHTEEQDGCEQGVCLHCARKRSCLLLVCTCLQAACVSPCADHSIVNAALLVQPVLVLENEEAVAEIMQLKTMPIAGKGPPGFCLAPFVACRTFLPGLVYIHVWQPHLRRFRFHSTLTVFANVGLASVHACLAALQTACRVGCRIAWEC